MAILPGMFHLDIPQPLEKKPPDIHTMAKRKVIEDERMAEADSAESSSEESSSEDVCLSSEAVHKLSLTQSLGCGHAGRRVRMV